jgi:hypothetical protein
MVRYPSLYQINTRVWLRELANTLGRPAILADIPDAFLDQVAAQGFDYLWFLGLWQTGSAGRQVSLGHPEWLKEFQATLPGFTEDDVSGSPFAVTGYTLHRDFGQVADLLSLKERLGARGLSSSWTLSPTTRPRIIPGWSSTPSSMFREAPPTWSGNPIITGGLKPPAAPLSWPTAVTPTSPAGPIPSRSTIATRA